MYTLIFANPMLFLSTLSLRRATRIFAYGRRITRISIHALLAESDKGIYHGLRVEMISIHALLAESDECARGPLRAKGPFLSTLSLRRATHADVTAVRMTEISIHALLAESDFCQTDQD